MAEQPGSGALDDETLALAHQMFELARNGGADVLGEALASGLPPNLTNDKGDTLLILAAYHDQLPCVEVLLEAGADHGRVNDRGQTALGSAVFRRNELITKALLKAGADPAAGGQSALAVAQFFELPQMLQLLQGE